ncbi:MAG TPA: crossover junction endodeoxyribonuclease RuvC [Candidatus Scatavimonas merdigallinarum]|uniref:Crossover junction endodeoxyribonuclease RuvC n=1 Tax=Candidatus Scatavimonas merdigallinarum TaxID=2840914 RepID=A0A9D0ZJB1_9FIRM|nr:crossover junction endodeoxyribonuclease RuvC [Candidatus Scatavimonas merdigallinarum]
MVVLGIDPGYAIVGWGVVDFRNNRHTPLAFGAITTQAQQPFGVRLQSIYDRLMQVMDACHPDFMAIEKLYFQNNQKTAINVAQARGVILLAAQKNGVEVFEYTPLQVKTAVTGYGQAKKVQVMEMTRRLLHLQQVPKPDDTADALAIAICHTQASGTRLREMLYKRGRNQ